MIVLLTSELLANAIIPVGMKQQNVASRAHIKKSGGAGTTIAL